MSSSHTTGCDYRTVWKWTKTAWVFRDQHIVHRGAGEDCRDFDAYARFTRQVLRTMNRNIHISGNKGTLDFCREQSLSSRARINNSDFVALCRDNLRLDCDVR